MSDDGQTVVRFDQAGQADLAVSTEEWAQNLIDQRWLESGVKHVRET